MKRLRTTLIAAAAATLFGGAALAQDTPLYNDGRINQNAHLGGIGIYCENQNGVVANSYENGGISVWGAEGAHYIYVSADEIAAAQSGEFTPTLRGDTAVQGAQGDDALNDQSQMGNDALTGGDDDNAAQDDDQASVETDVNAGRPNDALFDDEADMEEREAFEIATDILFSGNSMGALVAQARAVEGTLSLYVGEDNQFYLTGRDSQGNPYVFTWIGCSEASGSFFRLGSIPRADSGMMSENANDDDNDDDNNLNVTPEATEASGG